MKISNIVLSTLLIGAYAFTPADAAPQEKNMQQKVNKKEANKVENDNEINRLIPRSVLLTEAEKCALRLNHKGDKISYIARKGKSIELVVTDLSGNLLKKFDLKAARAVHSYSWAYDDVHMFVYQDEGGDENEHVISLNVKTGERKDLTPFKGAKSYVASIDKKFPDEIIIGCNKRDPQKFDFYRANLKTGELTCIYENKKYDSVRLDNDFKVRIAEKVTQDGGMDLFWIDENGKEEFYKKIPFEDTLTYSSGHFSADNSTLYECSSIGRDKPAIIAVDVKTKETKIVYENDAECISGCLYDKKDYRPVVVETEYLKSKYHVIDKNYADDIEFLNKYFKGQQYAVISQNHGDDKWVVVTYEPDVPSKYYLYSRKKGGTPASVKFICSTRPELEKYKLQPMEPVVIKSRDGLDLICYLTRAAGFKKGTPSSLVMFVHGGPWARDSYGFSGTVQFLANRGYSVLQVNYRGSEGFGKKFINAINKNLAGVRNDIIDAARWAIKEGIADVKKVAIMGGSFGGYSTLAGLTFTPDFFCCGVDIVGPSNWKTLFEKVPPYWKPYMIGWYKCVGSPETEEGREALRVNSPITYVDNIKKPLFVLQGENDPRVNKAESDQIVKLMKSKGLRVAYVLYPDEGHGFLREPNRMSSNILIEIFLSQVLGGWREPIGKDELDGSSHKILEQNGINFGLN